MQRRLEDSYRSLRALLSSSLLKNVSLCQSGCADCITNLVLIEWAYRGAHYSVLIISFSCFCNGEARGEYLITRRRKLEALLSPSALSLSLSLSR